MRYHTCFFFALCLCARAISGVDPQAGQQPRKFELSDLQKMVAVSNPAISPDGKSIAIIVSRVNWDKDSYDSQLVLVDIATSAQRQLTNIRKGLDSPQWSPTGDRLAFLAEAGGDAKEEKNATEQIFVLPMNGGEPQRITTAPLGVEQFSWRPDGAFFAFASPDEPLNKAEIEKHHDLFEVGDNSFLDTSAPTPSHLWIVSASGGTAKRLTSGSWSLAKDEDSTPLSSLSWSPDGKQICLTRQADPHVGDSDQTVLEIVDVDSGQMRQLTKRSSFEKFGVFSPDGSKIAYWFPRDGDFNNENEIFVAPSTGGDGTDLTGALDRNVRRAIWMPDGKSLLVNGNDGTRTVIWIQPLDGAARKVDLGKVNLEDANVGKDGSIAFAGSTPTHPTELYYVASPDAKPRRLTDFNHEIGALDLGDTDTFEWKGPDGFAEDGVILYPPHFSRDKKYPLVLLIHSGPTNASTTGFDPFELMASHGYVVFEPNYRGSDNRGSKYQLAIVKDLVDGPGRDIMSGIAALEKQGFIDESRIGVSGWSYGGYMTSWLISHYHIWRAAVSGAASNSRADAYNLSDHGVKWRFMVGGSPWKKDNAKTYEEQSPITYARAITTPTLILHNTGDPRVPITNAYAMYHALKDNGVAVKFIAVPVAGHFIDVSPVRESDIFRYWIDWLDQYLKASPSAPETLWPTNSWATASPASVGIDEQVLQKLDDDMTSGKYSQMIDSFAVFRCGKKVFERSYPHDYAKIYARQAEERGPYNMRLTGRYNYFDPYWHPYYHGTDLHTMQSISKTVTSVILGAAIDRGDFKASLDTPVLKYFDSSTVKNVDDRKHRMTLRHLLTMSSGLEWNATDFENTGTPDNDTSRMEASDDWVQYTIDKPMAAEPGKVWHYNDGAAVLLAYIFQKETGWDIDDYGQKFLFAPLGVRHEWKRSYMGVVDAEGGLYLTGSDLAKIGYLYLHDGTWDGQRIVSSQWVKESVTPYVQTDEPQVKYGFSGQWFLSKLPGRTEDDVWLTDGFGYQELMVFPEESLIVTITAWRVLRDSPGKEPEPPDFLPLVKTKTCLDNRH